MGSWDEYWKTLVSKHFLQISSRPGPTRASLPDEGLSARREQIRASPTRSPHGPPHGPPHDSPHTEADLRRMDGLQFKKPTLEAHHPPPGLWALLPPPGPFDYFSARALKPSRGIWSPPISVLEGTLDFNAIQSSEGLGFAALTRARGPHWGLNVGIYPTRCGSEGVQFTAVTRARGPSSAHLAEQLHAGDAAYALYIHLCLHTWLTFVCLTTPTWSPRSHGSPTIHRVVLIHGSHRFIVY